MIAAMVMVIALSGIAPADQTLLPDAAILADEATRWLLEGDSLPADYRARLMQMPPESRLQGLIFLRRSGLLTTDPWTLSDILKPAPAPAADTGAE